MPLSDPKSAIKDKYLCIDFLNTEYASKQGPVERLQTAQQVADWLIERGVFTDPADLAALRKWASEVPEQVVAQFQALRADLRPLFAALHAQQPLPPAELARLQALLRSGSRSGQLVLTDDGHWQLQSRLELRESAHLAVPLAESFAELAVAAEAGRVKACSNPHCTVFFFDTTKNQSRAWCATCGTQAKALRYYHKQKAKA
ncbi:CGNR zinc finger domain-containing protein [Hymenobacter terricola]|uniref:CGNR zinc finger domain-containing protein n=1 Tax=Hymenobacter terricola TaxID=2819236 RepID=UPI001B311C82|nr:ABATE domain-containing protein [Hymenobacter terricola]